MKKNKLVLIVAAGILGNGCTAFDYLENKERAEKVQNQIVETIEVERYKKAQYVEIPPFEIKEIKTEKAQKWLDEKFSILVNDLPLSLVLNKIVDGKSKIRYGSDVDPNQRVSFLSDEHTTKRTALDLLSLNTDFQITIKNDEIGINKYISKSFSIPSIAGLTSFQLGSKNSSGGTGSEDAASGESISKTDGDDGQHSNIKASDQSLIAQLEYGVQKILQKPDGEASDLQGSVGRIDSLNTLIVKTTPRLMDAVEEFIDTQTELLTRQVVLDIEVIEFTANEGSEFGLDFDLLYTSKDGVIGALLQPPTLADITNGTGISWQGLDGTRWEGSSALIKALNQFGKVSVTTRQTVTATNQQPQELDLSNIRGYFSATKTSFEGESSEPQVQIETDTVRDGVKMLVVPAVGKEDVFLRMTGTLSKFIGFETQTVGEVQVSQPQTRQSRYNIAGKYSFNNTIVVTSMRQETNQADEQSIANSKILGGNSGSKKTVDTIVLLTPRRAN